MTHLLVVTPFVLLINLSGKISQKSLNKSFLRSYECRKATPFTLWDPTIQRLAILIFFGILYSTSERTFILWPSFEYFFPTLVSQKWLIK